MKSRTAVVLLMAATLACSHAAPAPPEIPSVDLGERFTLTPGKSAGIAGTPVKITFERVLSETSRSLAQDLASPSGLGSASQPRPSA